MLHCEATCRPQPCSTLQRLLGQTMPNRSRCAAQCPARAVQGAAQRPSGQHSICWHLSCCLSSRWLHTDPLICCRLRPCRWVKLRISTKAMKTIEKRGLQVRLLGTALVAAACSIGVLSCSTHPTYHPPSGSSLGCYIWLLTGLLMMRASTCGSSPFRPCCASNLHPYGSPHWFAAVHGRRGGHRPVEAAVRGCAPAAPAVAGRERGPAAHGQEPARHEGGERLLNNAWEALLKRSWLLCCCWSVAGDGPRMAGRRPTMKEDGWPLRGWPCVRG